MPRSQSKKNRDGAQPPKKDQPAAGSTVTDESPPSPTVADNGNGAANYGHIGNGANHDRRRSGRVTYRPKATEMLTVHART